MVSIRASHLKQPADFSLEQWLATVNMPAKTKADLARAGEFAKQQQLQLSNSSWLRCVEIVEILLSLHMDHDSLLVGFLLPWLDENHVELAVIKAQFGDNIDRMSAAVLEMNTIRQLSLMQKETVSLEQMDNVRRMLLAMVEDFRCVVIKLAERVAYLRQIKNASEDERVLTANECAKIYAPLANRLGIGQIKWEMEDYCFRYLHPEQYKQIAALLRERRIDREQYIEDFVAHLKRAMAEEQIEVEIYGRPKHLYSIWRKMQKKDLSFAELFDTRAVRITAKRLQDCYAALGIVHTHYRHLPDEFDDYIANPKPNGYQSIHTVVLGPAGKTVEIQIRTQQMHEDAELGVAAHWRYKEGTTNVKAGHEERIAWLRKLLAWQEEMTDSGEMLEEVRSQVFDDRVYVFTPKGEVIDLPMGATPLDFAYHIHSDIGHRCIGAKVAGRIVPFSYQLQMGDQVDIITQKQPNPSRDWLNPHLNYITTSRARSKIHYWFRKQDKDKNVQAGKQLLDDELAQLGIGIKKVEKLLLARYNVNHLDELLANIGSGDLRVSQLVNYLQGQLNKEENAAQADQQALEKLTQKSQQNSERPVKQGRVIIEGVGNLLHHIARCCQPIPGDEIVGFITHGRGISIHAAECEQLAELRKQLPERVVEAAWGENYSHGYHLTVRVLANDRSGLLRDITTIFANEKVNVLGISSRSDIKQQTAIIDTDIEIYNLLALSRLITKLNYIPGVIEAKRFKPTSH